MNKMFEEHCTKMNDMLISSEEHNKKMNKIVEQYCMKTNETVEEHSTKIIEMLIRLKESQIENQRNME